MSSAHGHPRSSPELIRGCRLLPVHAPIYSPLADASTHLESGILRYLSSGIPGLFFSLYGLFVCNKYEPHASEYYARRNDFFLCCAQAWPLSPLSSRRSAQQNGRAPSASSPQYTSTLPPSLLPSFPPSLPPVPLPFCAFMARLPHAPTHPCIALYCVFLQRHPPPPTGDCVCFGLRNDGAFRRLSVIFFPTIFGRHEIHNSRVHIYNTVY